MVDRPRSFKDDAALACLPGEVHDLGLIAFGVLIARRGWRVPFLGADTPLDMVTSSARTVQPTLVVLATIDDPEVPGADR
jgi:methanogenic corrinoid protein MtbC1